VNGNLLSRRDMPSEQMRIAVAQEQCRLEEQHRSVPDGRDAAEIGQDQPAKERLHRKD
jgi:hypothetical protein